MLINKFSFQLAVQNVNTGENYIRRIFPYSQLLNWLTGQYSYSLVQGGKTTTNPF
jgi:hypothetical protein